MQSFNEKWGIKPGTLVPKPIEREPWERWDIKTCLEWIRKNEQKPEPGYQTEREMLEIMFENKNIQEEEYLNSLIDIVRNINSGAEPLFIGEPTLVPNSEQTSQVFNKMLNKDKMPLIENFISRNWKTLFLLITIVFAWFVWPTQYKQLQLRRGLIPQRENRFTKQVEYWDTQERQWK